MHLTIPATALPVLLLAATRLPADVVFLKDGTALHGKVKRQTTNFVDPASGQVIEVGRIGGFFMIDDGPRRIVFSHRQVQEVDEREIGGDLLTLRMPFTRVDNFRIPSAFRILDDPPFDSKWSRTVKMELPSGVIEVVQRLVLLTPYYGRVEFQRYPWSPCFLTRELPETVLRELLLQHPDLKPTGGPDDIDRRLRLVRFFVQAQFYDAAERELNRLQKEMPQAAERLAASRANLRKVRTSVFFEDLERAHQVGQHQLAQAALDYLLHSKEPAADDEILSKARALKARYDTANEQLATARRQLGELAASLEGVSQHALLREAASTIATEVTYESLDRLEAFVSMARQLQRDREQQRQPSQRPEEVLALAITGWLLGTSAAEAKVETAARLWRARQFVLAYQRTPSAFDRESMLQTYHQEEPAGCDEMDRLIRTLPPPEPFPVLGGAWPVVAGCWLHSGALAAGLWPSSLAPWPLACSYWPGSRPVTPGVLRLTARPWPPLGSDRPAVTYLLQLPPEYHHHRPWPVLIVLHHHLGDTPELMLRRWASLAARHGYLLVAPVWYSGDPRGYRYTAAEHGSVLQVVRDLRQRFQVDSDRVFLAGWGEGANMAYDVGLSHPDQFAGVIPIGGRPAKYARSYWRNAQYLPFYVVDGDVNGEGPGDNRRQFQHWVPKGYPALYVEYKGRALEWFAGELPFIFEWMSRKKRAFPFPELGKTGLPTGEEFQCLRPTDNHFYWLSADELDSRLQVEEARWTAKVFPAALQARIIEGTQLNVVAKGFKRVTVWLGLGMIDFDKSLTVRLNGRVVAVNRKVRPSLATLLEDFARRGDRQRLFWAKLDLGL